MKICPDLQSSILLAALLLDACQAAAEVTVLPSPAEEGSMAPNLFAAADGRVLMSWIDKLGENRHALRVAVREGERWSAPRLVAEGPDWFVNWADFPSIVALPDGTLAAHWLVKSAAATYAYDVRIAFSSDGGAHWSAPVVPHRDGTPTEHGFVSLFPTRDGRLGAAWLDGREMLPAADSGDGGGGMSGGPAGGGMSGGGIGLMSGGGLSTGSGGRGMSGRDGCSIMRLVRATRGPLHTSSPTARIRASALLRSTTPSRIR